MPDRVGILAAEACTALGADLETSWRQLLAGARGLRGTPPLGRVRELSEAPSRARALALAVARRLPLTPDTGLVLATTKAAIAHLPAYRNGQPAPDLLPPALCAALAAELGLAGPRVVVSNACASGLGAIRTACAWLRRGWAPRVLVLGVDALAPFVVAGFEALRALSPEACRPFDAARAGLSLGEGAGALLLGRGEARAFIAGCAERGDAEHITGPSPTGAGLRRAFAEVLAAAGWAAGEVDAVNAHGTATRKNDAMEAAALAATFPAELPVFALKGALGHTLGAAGVIEAALCVRALEAQWLPGSPGFARLGVAQPLAITREARAAPLRRMLSVKCGFGGLNAVVALEAV